MPQGGNLHITATNETFSSPSHDLPLVGEFVCVSLRDEGCGISQADQNRIFEPYFTTKTTGSGLGLATVHSIIKKHKGYIQYASTPGEGTTVSIYLPAEKEGTPAKTD